MSRAAQDLFVGSSLRLSESSRERAFSRALARAEAGNVPSLQARPGWLLYGVTFASAAAVGLMLWLGGSTTTPVTQVASTPQQSAQSSAAEPNAPALASWIDAQAARTLTFAHATVEAAQGSRLKFDEATAVLTLDQGQLDLDVDPAPGKPFWVHTKTFRVQVLGTQFSVTPEQVSVREGHVQVSDHQGKVLARDLAAGATFSMNAASEPHAAARAKPPTPSETRNSTRDPSSVLSQSRRALTKGDTGLCSQLLDTLEHVRLTRAQQAEASTLRAEISMLERNLASALKQYEALSKRFRDLPAGENAAFAAAQLAPRVAPAREKSLLETYLAHHPRGRFADEAAARLRTLSAP